MESTGIYWKSVFAHLEAAGVPALVVNAFHVKNVPRKVRFKPMQGRLGLIDLAGG